MKIKKLMFLLVFLASPLWIAEVNAQTKANTREIEASTIGLSVNPKKEAKAIETDIPKNVSKWIDDELAKVTKKPITDFNAPDFFNKANGRVVGYIKGYDVSLGFTTGMVYINNEITNEEIPVVIQIHPDGRFEVTIPLNMPKQSHLVIDNNWIPFYIEPEQTLSMVLDWNSIKKIDFKGPLAQVNKELSGYIPKEIDYASFENKIKTMSPDEFKKERLVLQKENLESAAKYSKDKAISPKAAEILKNDIFIKSATRLLDYVDNRVYIAENDTVNKILKIPVTNQYYDFLKELPLNQQSILVSKEFSIFVNRFEYSKPLRSNMKYRGKTIKAAKSIIEYFEEEGIAVSKEDKDLLDFMFNNPSKVTKAFLEKNKEKIIAFSEKYKDNLISYSKKYSPQGSEVESYRKDVLMANWKIKDSIMTNVLGLEKSLVYDFIKIRSLKSDLTFANKKAMEPYWESLKKDIANPFLIAEGNAVFDKAFAKKDVAYSLPAGKAADIFNKIIGPFKGKTVFVDFWATTCGPCVGNIKGMKEIRKKYEGNKDFEFVFITQDTASPTEHYRKFVKEQELKNTFVVLTDDFQYLRELFKFNGIPRYVVIDKNGKVLNDDFGMHNFEAQLDGILKASN